MGPYEQQVHTKNQILEVLRRMSERLKEHDSMEKQYIHKGMILASGTKEAEKIVEIWDTKVGYGTCESFIQGDKNDVLHKFQDPKNGNSRILVVIFRLTEGFDCKNVSVVAILRNVQKKITSLFCSVCWTSSSKVAPK